MKSKYVIFNIEDLLKEVFAWLDINCLINLPINALQLIYEAYIYKKKDFYYKLSKSETSDFINSILPKNYLKKEKLVKKLITKLEKTIEGDFNHNWGKISSALGKLKYNLDVMRIPKNVERIENKLNKKFLKYINENYEGLFYSSDSMVNSNLLHIIFKDRKKKRAMICFDCMGFEEWNVIKDYMRLYLKDIKLKENYSITLLPSETKYSRTSLFAGLVPKNIMALPFVNTLSWQYEEKLFKFSIQKKLKIDDCKIYYERQDLPDKLEISFDFFKEFEAIGIVFSFIDDLTHSKIRKMNKKLLINNIKIKLEESKLFEIIEALLTQNFEVFFVSDHGSILSKGVGKISKDLVDKRARRYLISENKIILETLSEKLENTKLVQFKNLIGKKFLLLFTGKNMIGSKSKSNLTHGGISIEEVIVPFIKVGYK